MATSDKNNKKKMFHQIDAIEAMSKLKEPVVSSNRKTELTEKLELQKNAQKRVAERAKRNELILSYDWNPFRDTNVNNGKPQGAKSIIDQINLINQQDVRQEFLIQKNQLIDGMDDLVVLSKKINLLDTGRFVFKAKEQVVEKEESVPDELNDLTMRLADIRKIEEKSTYLEKPKNFDLLKEVKTYQKTGKASKDYLEDFYFVRNSLMETIGMLNKESVYREISTMARNILVGKPVKQNVLDYIDSYELSFNVRDLNYNDLMNICSSRFKQDFLFTYLNEIEMEKDDKISLNMSQGDEDVVYDSEQHNLEIQTDELDMSQFEIECLIRAPLEEDEDRAYEQYSQMIQDIQEELQKKKKALLKGVTDKRVHDSKRQKIIENLKLFKLPNAITERQLKKMVGKNKLKKNKEQQIKLSAFKTAVKSTIEGFKQEDELKTAIIFR